MASSSAPSSSLLGDVRILSFGSFVAGNICALILAELGADVVKIESRDRPEALRAYDTPEVREAIEPSGIRTTALFAGMTRSLRSVSIDMNTHAGRETFRALAKQADVVLENLGPGKMEAWGCSFRELQEDKPQAIMVSISGYGRTGPLADFRAYASNINNFLGLTSAWAPDGIHFDFVVGTHAASAVVAALAAVEQGAPGVHIDMAQTEAGAAVMAPLYLDFLANGREWSAGPNEVPGALFSDVIRCRGADAWMAVELEDASDWQILCTFLSREDLSLTDGGTTPERRASLRAALEGWAESVTPYQAAVKLQHVGLAVGPVQDSEDLWRDLQFRSRRSFVEVYHPDIGSVEYPDSPNKLSETPGKAKHRGPRLGEHTGTVLVEWLDLTEAEVDSLRSSGAIWQPDQTSDPGQE